MKNLKIFVYLLCATALLAGCSNNEKNSSVSESSTVPDKYITEEDIIGFYEEEPYSEEQEAVLKSIATVYDSDGFCDKISGIVEYPALDDIPMEEAYQRWENLPEVDNTPEYGIVTDLPIDANELYEIVNRNTDMKIESDGLHGRSKLNEEDMRFCCEYICKTLNEELAEHKYPDQLDDIDANIANLTMYESIGLSNAGILDDGSMEFSRAMCENMIWVSGFEDSPKKTVAHETQHLMQKTSVKHCNEMGLERSYGFMAVWGDMEIDPLFYNWLIEGVAERLSANLYNTEPETYISKVAYLDSMSFVTVLDGYDSEDFAETTQQSELDVVFDMFRCETEAEKLELLYLLYANEVIQEEPEEFMAAYSDKLGHEITEDELVDMKIELKVSLLETLTKYFYQNLASLVSENELTFEVVCFLISGWEMDINSHISYTDTTRSEKVLPFLEYYLSIQELFFSELSETMKVEKDKLAELYKLYYNKVPSVQNSMIFEEMNEPWKYVELNVFDNETNKFVNDFFEGVSGNKAISVAEYYHSLNE